MCMNVSIYILVLIPAYTCTRLYVHPCLYFVSYFLCRVVDHGGGDYIDM